MTMTHIARNSHYQECPSPGTEEQTSTSTSVRPGSLKENSYIRTVAAEQVCTGSLKPYRPVLPDTVSRTEHGFDGYEFNSINFSWGWVIVTVEGCGEIEWNDVQSPCAIDMTLLMGGYRAVLNDEWCQVDDVGQIEINVFVFVYVVDTLNKAAWAAFWDSMRMAQKKCAQRFSESL